MTPPSSTPAFEPSPLSLESVHAILRAARFGVDTYPGPIGELIHRELTAYIDGGRQLPLSSIPERLLAFLRKAQDPEPKARYRLPAVYRKGSPMKWDYTPIEEDEDKTE